MTFSESDFITTQIHERQVVLGDGKAHAVHFRELSTTDLKRYAIWQLSEDEDVRAGAEARLLAIGVCSPEGEAVMDWERAAQLKLPVMRRLVTALLDVNGYGGGPQEVEVGKPSSPTPNSGSGTS